jgi:hypothetical protein
MGIFTYPAAFGFVKGSQEENPGSFAGELPKVVEDGLPDFFVSTSLRTSKRYVVSSVVNASPHVTF